MASMAIHLAIGQEYLKFNKVENKAEFLKGVLQPDFEENRNKSHYSRMPKDASLEEAAKSNVSLNLYAAEKNINSSFDKGYFLHLLTDYLFYYKFILNLKKFKATGIRDVKSVMKLIQSDYDKVTPFLIKEYNLDISILPPKGQGISNEKPAIMDKPEITKFINFCAKVSLENEYEKASSLKENYTLEII